MSKDALLELVKQYEKVRMNHSELTKTKDELSTQIKALIGDRLDVPVDGYRVSYHYDSNKEVTKFDEKKMEKKNPLDYKALVKLREKMQELTKKYTTTETIAGSRRLVIAALEE